MWWLAWRGRWLAGTCAKAPPAAGSDVQHALLLDKGNHLVQALP